MGSEAVLEVDECGGLAGDADVEGRRSARTLWTSSFVAALSWLRTARRRAARVSPRGLRGCDRGDVRQGADPVSEGPDLRRSGGGADDDLDRRGSARRELGASAWSTCCALALAGSMLASTGTNLIDRNGIPSAISTAALSMAILPRAAGHELREPVPEPASAGRASRSAARWSRLGASALTRGPSADRIAGSTTSASVAATSATSAPAIPIEYRNRCGKIASDATAAATVSELNRIVRPAVASVRRSVSTPNP